MLRCLLRLLLCLCLVANTATGAWASVGMAMPNTAMPQAATHAMPARMAAAMPCHDAMPAPDTAPLPDKTQHANASDCCKLGSCDCLQHASLALLTLPAVPARLLGHSGVTAALDEGRGSPAHEQPVRPPIG
ncbi:CopL family metal-binding regulatory protein [Xanthomonas dyei]|uniref:Copper homeostasis protein n=1 Tax=Xanthomonas dyei TaxID=743699 RepID=A0A2S7C6V1_9XANT|nr:CopL family metal-binding regulatory protein [Xanthomonas dyei]PPU57250.1 copper homeostasis protein [Xanthomonas dyei]